MNLMPAEPLDGKHEVVLRDKDDPKSLINLCPPILARTIEELPIEFIEKAEPELRTIFEKKKITVDAMDERLRYMFWKEYDHAMNTGRAMVMKHIYYGICSRDYFYVVLQNKARVAWMLCPPIDYTIAAEEALVFGINQLRDILALPHTDIGGRVNPKAASAKIDIVKMLDLRVKGAVIQTTRNLNMNVNANKPLAPPPSPKMEDVDRRIKELENMLNPKVEEKDITDIEVES